MRNLKNEVSFEWERKRKENEFYPTASGLGKHWDSLWGQAKIFIFFIVKPWTCLPFIYLTLQIRELPKHTAPQSHMSSAESDQAVDSIKLPSHGARINAGDGCQHSLMHYHYVQRREGSPCMQTNHFSALHPLEISYSIALFSWEVQGFQNTASTLWGHPKKINNYWYFTSFFVNKMLCYNAQEHAEYTLESKEEMLPCLFFINDWIWYFFYVTVHFSLWKTF